jgi:hypothetical protein
MHGRVTSKGKSIIELRRLCGHYLTVPGSYRLEDVVKGGGPAQRISQVTEIWKGRYNDELVALKVLRVPREDPQVGGIKSVSTPCDTLGGRVVCRCSDG